MAEKIKLMFDATILANAVQKNSGRSGIFFTAYQIVQRLMKNKEIELSFYCAPYQQYFFNQLKEFKKIPVYPYATVFDKWHTVLRKNKRMAKIRQKKGAKIFWHYVLFTKKILCYLPNQILKKTATPWTKLKLDAYFSPCERPPEEIVAMDKLKKYILIYDTTPLVLSHYFKDIQEGNSWILKLIHYMKSATKTHYFSISEQTKKDFLKYVPELKKEQITVTPLACSDTFHPCPTEETLKSLLKYHLPTDKKYVFSLCSLAPHKNLIRAVKTFIQFIKKNNIQDMVFILGGGHYEDFIGKLDAEISACGDYKDKIIKAGYIDDEDLAPLYSGAEWFVYTSQYEGFGLPPLEAMACGCPIITSNNSSLPEVVGDAGIMVDWDSDAQHIKAYEEYYYRPELREKMRQKGLARAQLFSWDKTVESILKEIKK
ncbi:MAG: glycosyltransferase family 4 protein [Alphaproteobacteria bacterium]